MKVALDSNVLAYVARVWRVEDDKAKTELLKPILRSLTALGPVIVPTQVLGECYNLMGRYGYARERCRTIVMGWTIQFQIQSADILSFSAALDLATEHRLQFWDALILNTAADAGCALLLSQDMQPGFTWRGVSIVNPFADPLDPKLARAMRG